MLVAERGILASEMRLLERGVRGTPNAIKELVDALRARYLTAARRGKKVILDEFCATTGYHRKSANRLLRRAAATGRPSAAPRAPAGVPWGSTVQPSVA